MLVLSLYYVNCYAILYVNTTAVTIWYHSKATMVGRVRTSNIELENMNKWTTEQVLRRYDLQTVFLTQPNRKVSGVLEVVLCDCAILQLCVRACLHVHVRACMRACAPVRACARAVRLCVSCTVLCLAHWASLSACYSFHHCPRTTSECISLYVKFKKMIRVKFRTTLLTPQIIESSWRHVIG